MKIRLELEINEQEFRTLRLNSLERVLRSIADARTHGDFITVQQDAAYLTPLASRLWYAASGATPEFDDADE